MNDRALSGVLMIAAAGALAWAWLTGRLDGAIAQVLSAAKGAQIVTSNIPAASTPGSRGESGFEKGGAGSGAGGGKIGAW